MTRGYSAEDFFETDAEVAKRERRAAKSGNKHGNPIALKAKVLAAVQDPHSPSSILVAASSGSVRRVNVETGETRSVYSGPKAPITCVVVGGPENQTIFAGSWDKDIWTWNYSSKALGRKYSGHSDFVKAVVYTKIGGKDILISGGADKKIMVWDIATGTRLHVLQDQTIQMMAVQDLVIDNVQSGRDEAVLVSASSDPNIRRWRIRLDSVEQITESSPSEPGAVRHAITEHETTVYKLVFDDEGDEADLWTSSGDGTAKCLSRQKGFATDDTIQHGDHVRAVALTDQWVITAGRDEDIKVWDRASGKLYAALEGHYDEVTDLVVMRSSVGGTEQVVSVSLDGTIRTWPLDKVGLDKLVQEQLDRGKGVEKKDDQAEADGLLTAEEEAELAALMEDDE